MEIVDNDEVCNSPSSSSLLHVLDGHAHAQLRQICTSLNGQFPVFQTPTQLQNFYTASTNLFTNASSSSSCILGPKKSPSPFYWTGIIKSGSNWIDSYTKSPVSTALTIDDNGLVSDDANCSMVLESRLHPKACSSTAPCGLCSPLEPSLLTLKGLLCLTRDSVSAFDTKYLVQGGVRKNGRLYFRGIKSSHIYFDDGDQRWTLQSLLYPGIIVKMIPKGHSQGFPIGRNTWIVQVYVIIWYKNEVHKI